MGTQRLIDAELYKLKSTSIKNNRLILFLASIFYLPSVLWRCCFGRRKGIQPVKNEWWDAGMVVCLGWGADLHMAQLMPLPFTISCSSKSRLVLPSWCRLTQIVPDKIQEGRKMVVCVRVYFLVCFARMRMCQQLVLFKFNKLLSNTESLLVDSLHTFAFLVTKRRLCTNSTFCVLITQQSCKFSWRIED